MVFVTIFNLLLFKIFVKVRAIPKMKINLITSIPNFIILSVNISVHPYAFYPFDFK